MRAAKRRSGSVVVAVRALAVAILIVACSTVGRRLPTAGELATSGRSEGLDAGAFDRGRAIAVTRCTQCHRLFWPEEHEPSEWPTILRRMGRRASLSPDEQRSVRTFYVSASRWSRRSRVGPEGSAR